METNTWKLKSFSALRKAILVQHNFLLENLKVLVHFKHFKNYKYFSTNFYLFIYFVYNC